MFYTSTYLYMRRPIHVSGLLISLWDQANPLFIHNKYMSHTQGNGYIKAKYKSGNTYK